MYILHLVCNDGETVFLNFDTYQEAERMKTAFMLMGQYKDSFIKRG